MNDDLTRSQWNLLLKWPVTVNWLMHNMPMHGIMFYLQTQFRVGSLSSKVKEINLLF